MFCMLIGCSFFHTSSSCCHVLVFQTFQSDISNVLWILLHFPFPLRNCYLPGCANCHVGDKYPVWLAVLMHPVFASCIWFTDHFKFARFHFVVLSHLNPSLKTVRITYITADADVLSMSHKPMYSWWNRILTVVVIGCQGNDY